jgi:FKBP-type peptidyl-prolyl cis-trans isomerase
MAKTHERVITLVMAFLFFATSVATGAFVIWQVRQENEANEQAQQLENEANNAQNTIDVNNQQEAANMLKGTKLANFEPNGEAEELKMIDIVEGTGEEVKEGDTITAHYTGAYAVNGEIFESSKDGGQPATFPLGNVIQGWQQGVPGMKEGGTRRLIIPGNLAYGEAPDGYTPGSTQQPMGTLVFDIELISISE